MGAVIIDTDPGYDDAVAILLAARHLPVVGITTVAGNQSIEHVTRNAQAILEFAGLGDIPVTRGADRPLVRSPDYPGRLPNSTGLDGADLPDPARPLMPVHAVDFIIDAARRYTGLTILALGPLTNLALALRREPRLAQQVAGICLMGGSLDRGNVTPFAEFNILCDPEAAHVVFTSGIPIKMCGLNLTRQATISVEDCRAFRSIGNRTGSVIADLMECYCSILGRVSGVPLASLHDVCAAAWLIDPTLITAWPLHVTIELTGTHTYGMTVCDYRHLRGPQGDLTREVGTSRGEPPNAEVALALHQPRFMRLLLDTLATYP